MYKPCTENRQHINEINQRLIDPPLKCSPFWKIFHPLPLFEKYFEGFCLYMLPVLGYSTKEELFTFNGQPGALECPTHGIGHQASVPPSILVGHISDVQNLRFGQVERRLLKYKKGLRLNNALLIKTRTMQRTTGKFVSWFFSPILLRTIFKKFIVSLIYWGEASYDQSITTAGLLKHKNIKYIHVIFNNINTIMHTGLQRFLIYHLMFVRTMYGTCLSS